MQRRGFTLIELMVVIVIMAFLASLSIGADLILLRQGRDAERQSDATAIARYLEDYYRVNASVSAPSYPITTAAAVQTAIKSMSGDTIDIMTAPDATTLSLTVNTAAFPPTPTKTQYIYQAFSQPTGTTICSASPCVRFKLYYLSESKGVQVIESIHQQ